LTPSALSPPRATELCRRHFVSDPFFLGDRRVQVRLFRFSRARFRPCFLSRGEKRGVKISPRKWMRSRPSWRSPGDGRGDSSAATVSSVRALFFGDAVRGDHLV
jgi:hypothetical protein